MLCTRIGQTKQGRRLLLCYFPLIGVYLSVCIYFFVIYVRCVYHVLRFNFLIVYKGEQLCLFFKVSSSDISYKIRRYVRSITNFEVGLIAYVKICVSNFYVMDTVGRSWKVWVFA